MPALITHRLFGEESIERLPQGIISTEEERTAFLLANQGPDPFFFRFRTLNASSCMKLGHTMHRCKVSPQLAALKEGVEYLNEHDMGVGRAWTLGLLSHYVLDRTAHPFVYAQQWGIQEADETLEPAASKVHAVIESDLDVLMLQLKRNNATVVDYPPAAELVTNERVNKVAGALTSFMATKVYDIKIAAHEYGGAVADMQFVYRNIEPLGSARSTAIAKIESLKGNYSLFKALAHPVTTEKPAGAGNLSERLWINPFTKEESTASFPQIFDHALDEYEKAAALFIEADDLSKVTNHTNYSGRVLDADEACDTEE